MFDPREKIALFIDGANLYAASKSLGFDIDYRKLLKAFQKPAASNAVVADLMDLVEKLHIAEQRQSARSYASTAGMAA